MRLYNVSLAGSLSATSEACSAPLAQFWDNDCLATGEQVSAVAVSKVEKSKLSLIKYYSKLSKWEQGQNWDQQICLPAFLLRAMLNGIDHPRSRCQRSMYLLPTWSPLLKSTQYRLLLDSALLLSLTYCWKSFKWGWLKQAMTSWAMHPPTSGRCWEENPETDIHWALDK